MPSPQVLAAPLVVMPSRRRSHRSSREVAEPAEPLPPQVHCTHGVTPRLSTQDSDLHAVPASIVTVLDDPPAKPAPDLVLPSCVARRESVAAQPDESPGYSFGGLHPSFFESNVIPSVAQPEKGGPSVTVVDATIRRNPGMGTTLGRPMAQLVVTSPPPSMLPSSSLQLSSTALRSCPTRMPKSKPQPSQPSSAQLRSSLSRAKVSKSSPRHSLAPRRLPKAAKTIRYGTQADSVKVEKETLVVPEIWVWEDKSEFERVASSVGPLPEHVLDELWQREVDLALKEAKAKKLILRENLKNAAKTTPQRGSASQVSSRREAEVSRRFVHMKVSELESRLREAVRMNALLCALYKRTMANTEPNTTGEEVRSTKRRKVATSSTNAGDDHTNKEEAGENN